MVRALVASSGQAQAVEMPDDVAEAMATLRAFLFERVYLGPARGEAEKAGTIVHALCTHLRSHPDEVPDGRPEDDLDQRIIDHVAGMTDRFALRAYADRFLPRGIS
jgi:dGTPase